MKNDSSIDTSSHMDGGQTHILEVDNQTHTVDNHVEQEINVSDEKQHRAACKKIAILVVCLILVTLAVVIPLTWKLLKKNKESNGSSAKSGFLAKQSVSPLTEDEVKQAMTDLVRGESVEEDYVQQLTEETKQRGSNGYCSKSKPIVCDQYLVAALWKKNYLQTSEWTWSRSDTRWWAKDNMLALSLQAQDALASKADFLVKSVGAVAQGLPNSERLGPLRFMVEIVFKNRQQYSQLEQEVGAFKDELIKLAQWNKAVDLSPKFHEYSYEGLI